MVFQNYALWPHMTVFQNIAYGLRLRRLRGPALAARVEEGLRKVNLSGLEARYPGQLSSGQQQRLPSRGRWSSTSTFCSSTSRSRTWTRRSRCRCGRRSGRSQQELGITTTT